MSSLPTRSEIESWDVSHLEDGASRWRSEADKSEQLFGQHVQSLRAPGGTTWTGAAAEAAITRGEDDLAVVRKQGDTLREAASIADDGAQSQRSMRRAVLDAVGEAEAEGFKVNDDLSVTDTRKTDKQSQAGRATLGTQHADYIRWRAAQLTAGDELIARQLQTKATELHNTVFDDGRHEVRPMDNSTPVPQPSDPLTADEVRKRVEELQRGKNPPVRQVSTDTDLRNFYNEITRGSQTVPDRNDPNKLWQQLPDGTRIRWREVSSNSEGPAIDISYPADSPGRQYDKIHVAEGGGGGGTGPGEGTGGSAGTSPRGGGSPPPSSAPEPIHPKGGAGPVEVPEQAPPHGGIGGGPSPDGTFPHPVNLPHQRHIPVAGEPPDEYPEPAE